MWGGSTADIKWTTGFFSFPFQYGCPEFPLHWDDLSHYCYYFNNTLSDYRNNLCSLEKTWKVWERIEKEGKIAHNQHPRYNYTFYFGILGVAPFSHVVCVSAQLDHILCQVPPLVCSTHPVSVSSLSFSWVPWVVSRVLVLPSNIYLKYNKDMSQRVLSILLQ